MDVAARPSGHKRGLSAYDSQLASFDPTGKVARPSEEEAPDGGAEQQEQQHEEQPLTESAAFHLRTLRDMQANVVEQIDNLQGERSRLGRRRSRGAGRRPAAAHSRRQQCLLLSLHCRPARACIAAAADALSCALRVGMLLPSHATAPCLPA